MFETVLFNQTFPRAYKRGKDPTVAPAHALKTLFCQVVSNKIENNTRQTFSRFIQRSDVHDWRFMNVSPLLAKPPLRNILATKNYVQNAITLVSADLPILHLKMILSENAHFQSPKVSIKITSLGLRRTRKRHEPQTLTPTLANSQPTHQTLKSPPLLLRIGIFTLFNVTSKVEIKPSRRQFLGDWVGTLESQQEKREWYSSTHGLVARERFELSSMAPKATMLVHYSRRKGALPSTGLPGLLR